MHMLKHIATYGFHFLEMYLHVQKLHSIIAPSHLSVFAMLLTARRNRFRAVMDTEEELCGVMDTEELIIIIVFFQLFSKIKKKVP